jgi:hypothetical protein
VENLRERSYQRKTKKRKEVEKTTRHIQKKISKKKYDDKDE